MLNKIKQILSEKLKSSSHDLTHTYRVYRNCLKIAESEPDITVDMNVLTVAALLHDIARPDEDLHPELKIDHAILGSEKAYEILIGLGAEEAFSKKVSDAIKTHRFRGGLIPESIEAKILFDADKLDIIGNIGIARSYMIAGEQKQDIYNDCDINEYIKLNLVGGVASGKIIDLKKHTPNIEFLTKDVNIPDRMFTKTGRSLAQKRIERMKQFFEILKQEIDGNA